MAKRRDIEVAYHDKQSLSRISKNAKQDQGVALDIIMPNFASLESFESSDRYRIIALDGVTNPQNLGMIIRSCAAGSIDAIVIPSKGAAQISPLAIKASAGTIFKIPIIRVQSLKQGISRLQGRGATIYTLSSDANSDYREESYASKQIFVLGNESSGVSEAIESISDRAISIPMGRGVESLNVAVTAALIAFMNIK